MIILSIFLITFNIERVQTKSSRDKNLFLVDISKYDVKIVITIEKIA